jgi:transposase
LDINIPEKRDFAWLERRRMKAARWLQQGMRCAEVARRVGVHRQSVSRWKAQIEQQGLAALKQASRAGRKPKLTPEDLVQLEEALLKGPKALGYITEIWTTQRVAELIQQRFHVRYHRDHVGRLLAQLHWSCQRPTGRSKERDEAAIQGWKRVEWFRIKKRPSS